MSQAPEIQETEIPGVLEIYTPAFSDERGFFSETYNQTAWEQSGFSQSFLQDNLSMSCKGALRGMHYQLNPYGMGKLIRVLTGAVYDVAVDLRKGSPTFGQWMARTLDDATPMWLWIPAGFAHGFLALQDQTRVYYKCTQRYNRESERAIRYNDPDLDILWPAAAAVISKKDSQAPLFKDAEYNFSFSR
ncbi:MAG: dTDP-4-dehydrorhamnose 3,5-epimerase [Candidatus Hydrogenedentes bacterium]|jgi:dTDP-4-dehydrorhamnose 3,5-epimerase|nr:dTDP-4-dehydrorhamnose 3,5-epimerase [Candidatus Hydrogenedentota bacterium]